MPSNYTHVCWFCRRVNKDPRLTRECPACGCQMDNMGKRWKAPRRGQEQKWRIQERRHEQGLLPNGVAMHTLICRWCGQLADRDHTKLMDSLRPERWWQNTRWDYHHRSPWKGEKK